MASKIELAEEANALAEALEIEVVTEGLNHADLTALVKDLKKRTEVVEPTPEPEVVEPTPEPEVVEPTPGADAECVPSYEVAEGKSVTSLRGIRGPGVTVTAEDFPGGQETLDAIVARGDAVKR